MERSSRRFGATALVLCFLCVTATPEARAADGPASAAGQAAQRASVNVKDLVKGVALAPPTAIVPKRVHSPRRVPRRAPVAPGGGNAGGPVSGRVQVDLRRAAAAEAEAPAHPAAAKVVHAPRQLRGDGMRKALDVRRSLTLDDPSPAPASTFKALGDAGTAIPPDTSGAAGPDHLVVALNTELGVQDRNGTELLRIRLDNFWKRLATPSAPSTFDPKVYYDRFENRWILVSCGDAESATSCLLVGTSRTADPTADWNLYRIDVDPQHQTWFDYPSVGFNNKWIVVQGNIFGINDDSFHSNVYVFNKADLYANGSGKYRLLTDPNLGLTQAPELNCDNSDSMHLVESISTPSNQQLKLYQITGTVDAPQLAAVGNAIDLPAPWAFNPPDDKDFAPQKAATQKIQTDDSRMQAVVSRNGMLWCVQTVFFPTATATRSAIQWCQLDLSTNQLKQSGVIDDETSATFRAFPSIAVNKNEDVLIGYSHFTNGEFASCAYSYRKKDDPAGSVRRETVFKNGTATYYKVFGGNKNRWGDYSNTVVDTNDTDFWTLQEFADQPPDHFGTQWALVKP